MNSEITESLRINYSDIFFSCYFNNEVSCHKKIEDHTLVYVYAGELLVDENDKKTKIHGGECVFIRRDNRVNMTKQPKGEEQFRAIFMVLKRDYLREFYRSIDKNRLPDDSEKFKLSVIKLTKTPDITSLFQSMVPYFDTAIKPADQLMKLKLQECVYSLLNLDKRFYSCLFDFAEQWKIDILDYLDENFMCDLSLAEIANFTGRSLAAFKRDFKKISSLPPQKWLIEKRLKVAYDKIRNDNMKVSDVYLEVGFKNLSHFSTAFKKQFGFAPTK